MTEYKYNRFINNTLPKPQDTNLNLIVDYENSSVLNLEEAVQGLVPLVSGAVDYALKAKKDCNRDSTLLTLDESAAIYLYTMSTPFVSSLNQTLRNDNRHMLKAWLAFLKLFITALAKLPSVTAIVWRGVNFDVTPQFVDNDVYTWWGVSSCSMNIQSVQPFLGESGTLFVIETIHGKHVSAFSAVPDEQEVILMPGTRVHAKHQPFNFIDRLFIIHLQEVTSQKLVYGLVNENLSKNALMGNAETWSCHKDSELP